MFRGVGLWGGDERAWAVKLSRQPEADPLELCAELVGPGLHKDKPDAVGAILIGQQMFSQAAYNIEHSNAANSPAAHLAGLEGVLRAYAVIIATKPDVRNPYFDKLADLQAQGKLQGFVDQAVRTCNKH